MKEMFGRWEIEEGELKVAVVFDGYEDVEMKRRSLALGEDTEEPDLGEET